ncbi:MAG TPA: GtrA family protein [Mycobacteriales bacterium]|nr:GtrA family protein [Mycobacteriales bacterium]
MQTDHSPAPPAPPAPAPRSRLQAFGRSSLARYLLVGGLSFGVDAGLLVALREGAHAPLLLAASVAFWSALVFNFTLNRLWSFGGREDVKISFAKYLTLVAGNYLGTLGILSVGTRVGFNYVLVKAGAAGTAVCWNYLAYRFWVFR